uniref:Uncharacterized protein n=1 Tax=Glossina palpalis gambiensis TaxID=67801 RepID=A0A1B0BQX8_9MUSC
MTPPITPAMLKKLMQLQSILAKKPIRHGLLVLTEFEKIESFLIWILNNVKRLLVASTLLLIEWITKAYCDFLKNHLFTLNCLGISKPAGTCDCKESYNRCQKYIQKNYLEIVNTREHLHTKCLMNSVAAEFYIKNNPRCKDHLMNAMEYHLKTEERCLLSKDSTKKGNQVEWDPM